MKPIFLSILLTTSLSFAQTAGKEDYKNTLKGPVSSIRIVTYKALDKGGGNYDKGEVEKGMENLLISYDKKGNMTEKIAYYPNGSVWWTANYKYEGSDVKKKAPAKKEIKKAAPLEKGEEGFKGKVLYRYDKKGQKTEETSYDDKGALLWRYVYRYDTKGNQIERDSFDPQGTLIGREICRYDQNNRMTERSISMKNQLAYQGKWEYDDKGKVLKKEEFFTEHIAPEKINSLVEDELRIKGVLWKKFVYSYDNKGNRTEVNIYDAKANEHPSRQPEAVKEPEKEEPKELSYDEIPNPKLLFVEEYNNVGALWKKDIYTYDESGKITQVKSMDNKDKPQFNYTYTYDDKGNETERATYDKNDKLVQRITYAYDDNGNMTEMVEYDANNKLSQKETYKYDVKNKKIEQQGYNLNGSLAYTFKYLYNPKGELIETRTFDPAGNLTSKLTQHFKFDAYKNWTERIQYTDGKGSYITERIIEYHKSN